MISAKTRLPEEVGVRGRGEAVCEEERVAGSALSGDGRVVVLESTLGCDDLVEMAQW